jgi:hypothetical protein
MVNLISSLSNIKIELPCYDNYLRKIIERNMGTYTTQKY